MMFLSFFFQSPTYAKVQPDHEYQSKPDKFSESQIRDQYLKTPTFELLSDSQFSILEAAPPTEKVPNFNPRSQHEAATTQVVENDQTQFRHPATIQQPRRVQKRTENLIRSPPETVSPINNGKHRESSHATSSVYFDAVDTIRSPPRKIERLAPEEVKPNDTTVSTTLFDYISRDVRSSAMETETSPFVASFNLMAASVIDMPLSMLKTPERNVPDGWSEKTTGRGETFWVHLQTGRMVDDLSKCEEVLKSVDVNNLSVFKTDLRKAKMQTKKRMLWPLPAGIV
jgi:hypothetical protein